MKRPFLWIFFTLLVTFFLVLARNRDLLEKKAYSMNAFFSQSCQGTLLGEVEDIQEKPNSRFLYLRNATVTLDTTKQIFSFSRFLVLVPKENKETYSMGNTLSIKGSVTKLQIPGNPGQFHEKAYYLENSISYKMYATSIKVTNTSYFPLKNKILSFKSCLKNVYESCLSKKEAGILTAMILGDKSKLDPDMKELYQINGISHILAISGLHISILCLAIYSLLERLFLPKPIPFFITTVFLFFYGYMTGFSISTVRAILMMLLMLFSLQLERSYDAITALAVSGIFTLLQKPFALFSSGFLLSYLAVLGIVWLQPILKGIVWGTLMEQEKRTHKQHQLQKERQKNSKLPFVITLCFTGKEKLQSLFLTSLSVQIAILPVILFFYYEFPVYGILINLWILPFLSLLVILAFLGGIAGMVFLPVGKMLLFLVHHILVFYETLCRFFQNLPGSIFITGCPKLWYLFLYYGILLLLLIHLRPIIYYKEHFPPSKKFLACFLTVFLIFFLIMPFPVSTFQCTLLDVGQGDGIFLRNDNGMTILVDGGSTDVKDVGKYRIVPYLKYHAVRKIDYMIMTHSDEDHISGQVDLMKHQKSYGIQIKTLLLPEPAKSLKNNNYHQMLLTAKKNHILVKYIHAGDKIYSGSLQIHCLHPKKGFSGESVNGYSTTLLVKYKEISLLLTGDLEKDGEEEVLNVLKNHFSSIPKIPLLKIAHHGSKYSTSREFLKQVSPKHCLISCGQNNSYGHPHKELLARLAKIHAHVYTTPESGAITVEYKKKGYTLSTWKSCERR